MEAAAYFCCLEAVQNAAKHSGAATIRVELRAEPGSLVCVIEDDGVGIRAGRAVSAGSGLANMRDRVESVGGRSPSGPPGQVARGSGRGSRRRAAECAPGIAWLLAGATLVLVVADVVVTAQYRPLLSEAAVAVHGFPFVSGAVLGCAVMGALIVSRDDRHPIGWLLTVVGFTSAVSLLCEAYSIWVTSEGGPGTRALGGVTGWLSTFFGGQLAIAGIGADVPPGAGRALPLPTVEVRRLGHGARTGPVHARVWSIVNPTHYDIQADAGRGRVRRRRCCSPSGSC